MVAVEPRKQHKGFIFLSKSKVVKGKSKILVRSSSNKNCSAICLYKNKSSFDNPYIL